MDNMFPFTATQFSQYKCAVVRQFFIQEYVQTKHARLGLKIPINDVNVNICSIFYNFAIFNHNPWLSLSTLKIVNNFGIVHNGWQIQTSHSLTCNILKTLFVLALLWVDLIPIEKLSLQMKNTIYDTCNAYYPITCCR